jgi:hypothetical protein
MKGKTISIRCGKPLIEKSAHTVVIDPVVVVQQPAAYSPSIESLAAGRKMPEISILT